MNSYLTYRYLFLCFFLLMEVDISTDDSLDKKKTIAFAKEIIEERIK